MLPPAAQKNWPPFSAGGSVSAKGPGSVGDAGPFLFEKMMNYE
jgi:hypothetical protein